jgi:hypothetical protein
MRNLSDLSDSVGSGPSDTIPERSSTLEPIVGVSERIAPARAAGAPPAAELFVPPDVLTAALDYYHRGLVPIPLCSPISRGRCRHHGLCNSPGKVPLIAWRRYTQARPSRGQVRKWFERRPAPNLAVLTGSLSNLVVLDVEAHAVHLCPLESLPITSAVRTHSGGYHAWFTHATGITTHPLNTGEVHIGDVKSEGGYVVAPPSIGLKGIYGWIRDRSFSEVPRAEAPSWLGDPRTVGAKAAGAAAPAAGGAGAGRARGSDVRQSDEPPNVAERLTNLVGDAESDGVRQVRHRPGHPATILPPNFPPHLRELLAHGFEVGCGYATRSEAEQAVIRDLRRLGANVDYISVVLGNSALGSKLREKGASASSYLSTSITRADMHLGAHQSRPVSAVDLEIRQVFAPYDTAGSGIPSGVRINVLLVVLNREHARQQVLEGFSAPDQHRHTEARWAAFWRALDLPVPGDAELADAWSHLVGRRFQAELWHLQGRLRVRRFFRSEQ